MEEVKAKEEEIEEVYTPGQLSARILAAAGGGANTKINNIETKAATKASLSQSQPTSQAESVSAYERPETETETKKEPSSNTEGTT